MIHTLKLPKELTLDYNKWRCGKYGEYALGTGDTQLLAPDASCSPDLQDHTMCCLGQWSNQAGVPLQRLRGMGDPECLLGDISNHWEPEPEDEGYRIDAFFKNNNSSEFAVTAMRINDDADTTPWEKADSLQGLCEAHGYKLTLKNFPERI